MTEHMRRDPLVGEGRALLLRNRDVLLQQVLHSVTAEVASVTRTGEERLLRASFALLRPIPEDCCYRRRDGRETLLVPLAGAADMGRAVELDILEAQADGLGDHARNDAPHRRRR